MTHPIGQTGTRGPARARANSSALLREHAVNRLERLIDIARLLASLDTVDQTFHDVITLAASILPLESAILLEVEGERHKVTSWSPRNRDIAITMAAQAHAEAMLNYLAGAASDQWKPPVSGRFIVLPLVVADRPIFGALLMEGTAFVRQDLMFINAIANQFAVALDRDRAWKSDIARRAEAEAMEETLRAQADAILTADAQRSKFLSVLAEELRSSLAASRELWRSLSTMPGSARIARALASMQTQLRQTAQLIDDLHGLSALTREELQVQKTRVDICALLARVAKHGAERLGALGHSLSVAIPCEPAYICADATRIEQVVDTLLDKASLLVSPGGRIWMSARVAGSFEAPRGSAGPAGPQVIVTIRDDGAGTVKAVLPRVYDLLNTDSSRIDPDDTRFGGGLKLMQRVVELHDAAVYASSAGLGLGSEFQLRLPIDSRPVAPAPATLRPERRSS